ncbi:hypothetical protein N3K66_003460 [Trichothecium roseum]|uniref:Uncharacterized protein n=1 Tax=Trichothecium roseum TaxID=47278 RepID=A0ACC0V5J3_9HYPO|nr:hypothetical protein N3K66_003460 [Trichothecium roseum]
MLEYPRAVPAMHQQPDHGAAPQVPSGWAVRWNDQYQTWFYVNTHTSVSQWHPPTEPVFPPGTGSAHAMPPHQDVRYSLTDDEALARRLQAEEDAMSGGGGGMGMGMSAHDQHPAAQPPRPHSGVGYDGFAPVAPQVPYGVQHSAAAAGGDAGYSPGAYAETSPGRHSGSFSSTGGPIDPSYHQQYPHLQGQQSGGGGGNRQSRLLGKVYDKVGGKLAVAGVGAGALRPSSSSGRLSPYPQDQHHQHPQRPTSAGGYYPDTHSYGSSNGGGGGKKSNKKKYLAALGLGGGAAAVGGGAGAAGYYGGQELSDGLGDGIDGGGKESRLSKYSDKYGSKIAKKLFKDSGHGEEEGGEGGEGGGGEEDDGGDDGGLGEALGEGAGEGSGEGIGEVIGALLGG